MRFLAGKVCVHFVLEVENADEKGSFELPILGGKMGRNIWEASINSLASTKYTELTIQNSTNESGIFVYWRDNKATCDTFVLMLEEATGVETKVDCNKFIESEEQGFPDTLKYCKIIFDMDTLGEVASSDSSSMRNRECSKLVMKILSGCESGGEPKKTNQMKIKLISNCFNIQWGGQKSGILDVEDIYNMGDQFDCINKYSIVMHELYEQYQHQVKGSPSAHQLACTAEGVITGWERSPTRGKENIKQREVTIIEKKHDVPDAKINVEPPRVYLSKGYKKSNSYPKAPQSHIKCSEFKYTHDNKSELIRVFSVNNCVAMVFKITEDEKEEARLRMINNALSTYMYGETGARFF